MGYRNRMTMAIDEAMESLKKAREMIAHGEFPEECDTSKFLLRVAEAQGHVNFVVHEAGECMVAREPKADT